MAQNTTVDVGSEWVQLTNADITTTISFQNQGHRKIYVKGTASASAPTTIDGAIEYEAGMGEAAVSLDDLFPGLSAVRLYAIGGASSSRVFVSHD